MLIIKTNAQNLVPNPSFENYSSCPNAQGQIFYAPPWTSAGNTPDYFNSCANPVDPYYGIPWGGGQQNAMSGNAYAGFIGCYFTGVQREYIQVQLSDTLIAGKCYIASFYTVISNPCVYGGNNLAASITVDSFNFSGFGFYNSPSHIYKFGNPIIIDTLAWVEIKGIYTAQGGEDYITIGNFKDDTETDTLNINPWPSGTYNGVYYLIDDVSLIPIDSITGGMSAFAGNDTNVVIGDSVFIGQEITNLNCNWSIGTTLIADSVSGLYVSPAVNTTYIVEQNLCGIITYDTIFVTVLPVGINENDWSKKINIYPNPSNGEFTVELPEGNILWKISVTDMQGRTIYEDVSDNKKISLNHVIENGIYIVHIDNLTTNETCIRKMVIQK